MKANDRVIPCGFRGQSSAFSSSVFKWRRHVTVMDRAGLEATSCECYPVIKREFARLVGGNGHAA